MANDEPFLMVNLKEEKTKKLANALTNKSAGKILTYLTNHDKVSEGDIAKALKLSTSTVNYAMKALVEAKLVVAKHYTYSAKGREVNQYSLAKKYIIISPDEDTENFFDKMKKYLPAVVLAAGTGIALSLHQAFNSSSQFVSKSAAMIAPESADMMIEESVKESRHRVYEVVPMHSQDTFSFSMHINAPEWLFPFLIGVGFTFFLLIVIDYLKRWWHKKKE